MKFIYRKIKEFVPVTMSENFTRYSIKPFNNIEDKYNVIFIHIPKTAGKSFYYSLFGEDMVPHQSLENYYKYDPVKFDKYLKVCVVRNPWDRFVSAFSYLNAIDDNLMHSDRDIKFANENLRRFDNVNDFLNEINLNKKLRKKILNWTHFKPQYKYIFVNDKNKVDYMCKFENLPSSYENIKNALNLDSGSVLLERNVNKERKKSYWDYFTYDSAKIIEEIYAKDIEEFGYSFPYEKIIRENQK